MTESPDIKKNACHFIPSSGQKRVQQFREQTLNKIQKGSSINGKYENTLALVAIKNMKYRYIQWKPS